MKQYLCIAGGITIVAAALFVAALFVQAPPPVHASSQFATILCDGFKPISITAASTVQIVTAGNANMFVYVCSYNISAGTADNFSIIEGTGATCGTGTLAMVGSTTVANGINLGANGNINFGGGSGAVTKTAVAGDNVCIVTSGAGPLAGVLGFTQAPF